MQEVVLNSLLPPVSNEITDGTKIDRATSPLVKTVHHPNPIKLNKHAGLSQDEDNRVITGILVSLLVIVLILVLVSTVLAAAYSPTPRSLRNQQVTAAFREGVTGIWFHRLDKPLGHETQILLRITLSDDPWFRLELITAPISENSSVANVAFGFVLDYRSRQSLYIYCGENGLNMNDLTTFCETAVPIYTNNSKTIFNKFETNETYEFSLMIAKATTKHSDEDNGAALLLIPHINGKQQPKFVERTQLPFRKVVQIQLSGPANLNWKVIGVYNHPYRETPST